VCGESTEKENAAPQDVFDLSELKASLLRQLSVS
jgi:hypothetical protein